MQNLTHRVYLQTETDGSPGPTSLVWNRYPPRYTTARVVRAIRNQGVVMNAATVTDQVFDVLDGTLDLDSDFTIAGIANYDVNSSTGSWC